MRESNAQLRTLGLLSLPEQTDSPLVRQILLLWQERVRAVYPTDTVDWQISQGCLLLCGATRDYLYGDFTPLELRYERGSRPELEAVLEQRVGVGRCRTQRELALAVMRFARDLWLANPDPDHPAFHGGTEEEVIAKGSKMCNEQARVMIVLAQMAGLPARYVGHIPGDHGAGEMFVDGGWAYFDVRGQYFVRPDGALASFAQIKQRPELIEQQPAEVLAEIAPGYSLASIREYARPQCMTFIGNYFVWERDRYGFGRSIPTPEMKARIEATKQRWQQLKSELYSGPPPFD